MAVRICKIILVVVVALLALVSSIGDIIQYGEYVIFQPAHPQVDGSSLAYVGFAGLAGLRRICVVLLEIGAAILCGGGVWGMIRRRRASAAQFNRSKQPALLGIAVGFLAWQLSFVTLDGQIMGMWMAAQWSGPRAAYRFLVLVGLIWLIVWRKDR